jgi:hypothetical protein
MSEDRPNFYAALDLDPTVDDWPAIEARIEEKKRRWNVVRLKHQGPRRGEAEAHLARVPEMKRVLADPALRRREAEARRRQLEAERLEVLAELDGRIETLRRAGGASEGQVEKLAIQFAGWLERSDVLARLEAAGVLQRGRPAGSRDREFLAEARMGEIGHELALLGQEDLYAFLGAQPSTAPEELARLAEERYKARVGRADRRSEAEQKLAGICHDLFRRPGGKAAYDASLATLPLRQLHADLDVLETGGKLPHAAIDRVVEEAAKHRLDPDLARDYVHWYARERGWMVAEPAPEERGSARFDKLAQQIDEILKAAEQERRAAERERERAQEVRRRAEEAAKQREAQKSAAQPPAPPPPRGPQPAEPSPSPSRSVLDAPASLGVFPVRRGFELHWSSTPGTGVLYQVVRKRGSIPQRETDGELQRQVASTQFQDLEVPPGEWYYAVYALRDGETSLDAAVSGPHRIKRGTASRRAAVATFAALGLGATAWLYPNIRALLFEQPKEEQPEEKPEEKPEHNKADEQQAQGTKHQRDETQRQERRKADTHPVRVIAETPKLAVIAGGDRQLLSPVEDTLVAELGRRGFEVAGRSGLLRTEDFLAGRGDASASALLPVVAEDGIDVLVRAEIEELGQRELQYLGRREVSTISRIAVRAYLVAERKPLGTITSGQVQHTPLNAVELLEEAAYELGDELRRAVTSGWSDYRKRHGLSP